jgi:L-malate glycosyltransferase
LTNNPPVDHRIRVLKFITLFAIGGTERQVVNLVRELDQTKFALQMACFQKTGPFLKDVESLGVQVSEFKIRKLYHAGTVRRQAELWRLLGRARIQIVHTYGFYAAVFASPVARLAGVPLIVSIRDTGELLTEWQKRAQRIACLLADTVLVNAEAVRQWLISQGCPAHKIEVIRNGIVLPSGQSPRTNIRQSLALPPDTRLVAMISRLNRLKGVEYFLEAIATLQGRFPDVHFLIVGDAPPQQPGYRAELEAVADRLGLRRRVTFTGFRTDPQELLSALYATVLPSLSEGLSNVLLESMASGVPVIATAVGGNPEIVEDGKNGLLVSPRDSLALAGALSRLLENRKLAGCFGERGKQRIQEQFDVRGMARRTEQHYLRLLSRRSARKDQLAREATA